MSDLFDGKQRVWFYLDRSDLYDGLAYDTDVKAVIITENKQDRKSTRLNSSHAT